MKTIVITSDKGGVGKSTLAALIIEWLNFNNVLGSVKEINVAI